MLLRTGRVNQRWNDRRQSEKQWFRQSSQLSPVLRFIPLPSSALDRRVTNDDIRRMKQDSGSSQALQEQCLALLTAYSVRDVELRANKGEYDGWLDRVCELESINTEQLSTLHGLLIAEGCLKFEFRGRSRGLQYQLANAGRQVVARGRFEPLDAADRAESSDAGESQRLSA